MRIKKYITKYDRGRISGIKSAIILAIATEDPEMQPFVREKLDTVFRLANKATTAEQRKIITWNINGLENRAKYNSPTVQELVQTLKRAVTETEKERNEKQ